MISARLSPSIGTDHSIGHAAILFLLMPVSPKNPSEVPLSPEGDAGHGREAGRKEIEAIKDPVERANAERLEESDVA